jgi:hypothetical protein
MSRFVSTPQDDARKCFSHQTNYPVLFSIGLSIYLWNIHVGVAVPVIAVTSIAALFYLAATVLPFIYEFCPYTTALSRLSKEQLGKWLRKGKKSVDPDATSDKVPMDIVTSRALSWMISSCETPSAVDTTIQAIAGADHSLPPAPLLECNALEMAAQRLEVCFSSNQLPVTDEGFASLVKLGSGSPAFRMIVLYSRVMIFLLQNGERDVLDTVKLAPIQSVTHTVCQRFSGLYHRLVHLHL